MPKKVVRFLIKYVTNAEAYFPLVDFRARNIYFSTPSRRKPFLRSDGAGSSAQLKSEA
jgi:hypothetical protein